MLYFPNVDADFQPILSKISPKATSFCFALDDAAALVLCDWNMLVFTPEQSSTCFPTLKWCLWRLLCEAEYTSERVAFLPYATSQFS